VAAETVITVLRLGGGDRKGHDYDQNVTRLQLGETAASAVRRTRRHEIRIRPVYISTAIKIVLEILAFAHRRLFVEDKLQHDMVVSLIKT
jgi:hypothetical protein